MTKSQQRMYFALKKRVTELFVENLDYNALDFLMSYAPADFWDQVIDEAKELKDPHPLPEFCRELPSLKLYPAFNPSDYEDEAD